MAELSAAVSAPVFAATNAASAVAAAVKSDRNVTTSMALWSVVSTEVHIRTMVKVVDVPRVVFPAFRIDRISFRDGRVYRRPTKI
ncbi:hypothetical protein HER10_EVM0007832 [Colletotrichum scovillei]|nr:uncharacterized protein HER10_EVM0007832 [Colletotrichum scovillei]KAF4783249.1 hypothetical protein HER10_EVM0007832 [Colletotrichum scovillei]